MTLLSLKGLSPSDIQVHYPDREFLVKDRDWFVSTLSHDSRFGYYYDNTRAKIAVNATLVDDVFLLPES